MTRSGRRMAFAASLALLLSPGPPARGQSAALFRTDLLHEVRLRVNARDWARLQATYQANTHYPCELTWNGIRLPNVAVRSRGAFTRNPLKPGLRLDFDRYAPAQRFLGLTSLVLENLLQDSSTMREALAMRVFAQLGVPASRVSHARVYVNGSYLGLYALVESVEDAAFLSRTTGDAGGVLYEYKWVDPWAFGYLGPDLAAYALRFEPRPDAEGPADLVYGPIEALVRTVNEVDDAAFESEAGRLIDLDEVVRQAALENAVADVDGLAGAWALNNFYLYRPGGGQPALTIPWDKDTSFVTANYPITANLADNVLFARALRVDRLWQLYADTLLAAADLLDRRDSDTAGAPTWAEAEIDRTYALVRDAVLEDPVRPWTVEEFEAGVEHLRSVARDRPRFIREEVARWRTSAPSGETRSFGSAKTVPARTRQRL